MDKTTLINLIAGVVAVPLIQFVKSKMGLDNTFALVLTVVISIVISAIVEFISGEFVLTNPDDFLKSLGLVISTATIVYRLLADSQKGQTLLNKMS